MFGQQPGNERRFGVMNQSIITKLDASNVTYYVLHTRGEHPRSILITALTAHYRKQKPDKKVSEVEDWIRSLVCDIAAEQTYESERDYDRVKETAIMLPNTSTESTLEAAVSKATGSCVLGIVQKKVSDEQST